MTSSPQHKTRRRLGAIIVVGTLAVAGLATGSLALFTNTATVGPNDFTTGTIDILLNGEADDSVAGMLTANNMFPGDTVTSALLTIGNGTSTGDLRFAVEATSTASTPAGLAQALRISIKTIDTGTPTATHECDLFNGTEVLAATALDSAAPVKLLGDKAAGGQAGDILFDVAGADLQWCVRIALPSDATGPQGASTAVTLNFFAEQTKNN